MINDQLLEKSAMSNRSSPLLDSRVNAVIDPLETTRRREVTAWYYPSELYGINHQENGNDIDVKSERSTSGFPRRRGDRSLGGCAPSGR